MRKKILSLFLFYTLLITGCGIANSKPTLTLDQMDKSPFTGIPCTAPCWYGLEIGKSSESEVMSTLPTLAFIDQKTVFVHKMSMPTLDLSTFAPGAEITANCLYSKNSCLTLSVVDNILTEIVVDLNYQISVNEAIGYLGNPDHIGYQNLGAERIICGVYLIWNKKQLVLFSQFEGIKEVEKNCYIVRDTEKVSADLQISEVRYTSVQALKFLISNGAGGFFEFTGTLPE